MDAKVSDSLSHTKTVDYEDFLLNEGLEVLANYRSISDDAVRSAIRDMLAALAGPITVNLN